MLLKTGEKIHVIVRRSFESDHRRHFVGEILATSGPIVRVHGYMLILDKNTNTFVKKTKPVTTILDAASSGYWVNILPPEISIADLHYTHDSNQNLILTDSKSFSRDVNEFGTKR